jgi:hypothetical protein
MLIKRHFSHPGFRQDAVDPGGMITVAIKQLPSGFKQLISFA